MRLRKYVGIVVLTLLGIGVLATAGFSQTKLLPGPPLNQIKQLKWEDRDIIIKVRGTWWNVIENTTQETIKKWFETNNIWGPLFLSSAIYFHLLHPRVKVVGIEWDMWGAEAGQRLMAGIASGYVPAKFYYQSMGNIPTCVEKGLLADITDTVLTRHADWWNALPECIRKNCMYKGRIWALPDRQSSNYPGDIIRYRRDYFQEAGIFNAAGEPDPNWDWTWKDFRDIAKKLTDPKKNRWGTTLEATGSRNTFEKICQTFGVPVLIPDKSGKYTWRAGFDTPETINTAFKLYHDLVFEDKTALVSVEYDWIGTRNEYLSGRVGMLYYPYNHVTQRALAYPHRLDPVKITTDIEGVAPWPKGPYGTRKMNESAFVTPSIGFDPTLTKEQLDAVVDLQLFTDFGPGVFMYSGLGYYLNIGLPESGITDLIGPKDMVKFPGAPSMDEYMPERYLKCKQFLHAQPIPPTRYEYNLALIDSAGFLSGIHSAVQSTITNPNWNEVVKSIHSAAKQVNVSALNNKTGTKEDLKAYFAALDKYYKDNYPTYYEKMFKSLWEKYYKLD